MLSDAPASSSHGLITSPERALNGLSSAYMLTFSSRNALNAWGGGLFASHKNKSKQDQDQDQDQEHRQQRRMIDILT